jgi:hypothetical protein
VNIENLKHGMVVKNYKEMCSLLGEDIKDGNSKKAQIEEWNRYFKFERNGHKFIINEVFNVPKCIEKTINSKYIEEIRDILVDYIFNHRDKEGKVTLTFSQLVDILGLANETYTMGNCRKRELSDVLNIDLKAVYYFYNNTRSELRKIIERALNSLKNRSVIYYENVIMIAEKQYLYTKEYEKAFRRATDNEIQIILDTQKLILEDMGLHSLQELFLSGNAKYKEFVKKVLLELPRDWAYYFNAYKIVYGEYAIKSEYNVLQRKKELNQKSIDRITQLLNANKEYETNEKRLIDILISLYNHDFALDNQIKELYDKRIREKDAKIKECYSNLNKLKIRESEIIANIDETEKSFNERDLISNYELYNYSSQVKKRSDVLVDIEGEIFY